MIIFVLCLVLSPNSAFAYGGGGGADISQLEDSSFGGGAVSWGSNPNGANVRGSSIWHGRPENIEKGPYQADTAVQDAEQDLLDGFNSGEYTADEVKTNLEWAQNVGIAISDEAQQTLDNIKNPPKTPGQPGQFTEKQQDKAVKVINYIAGYFELKDKCKEKGRKMTTGDLYGLGAKKAIKDKVPPKYKKYVDKAFDFLGF